MEPNDAAVDVENIGYDAVFLLVKCNKECCSQLQNAWHFLTGENE